MATQDNFLPRQRIPSGRRCPVWGPAGPSRVGAGNVPLPHPRRARALHPVGLRAPPTGAGESRAPAGRRRRGGSVRRPHVGGIPYRRPRTPQELTRLSYTVIQSPLRARPAPCTPSPVAPAEWALLGDRRSCMKVQDDGMPRTGPARGWGSVRHPLRRAPAWPQLVTAAGVGCLTAQDSAAFGVPSTTCPRTPAPSQNRTRGPRHGPRTRGGRARRQDHTPRQPCA